MATSVKDYDVNAGSTQLFGFRVVETAPPNSPFAKMFGLPGVQSTPSLARGNLNYSAIQLLNGNLEHACDFKFIFTIDVTAFGLINPVTAITDAIKNAQLKATERLKNLIKQATKKFTAQIDKVLEALSIDPSGQLSLQFQVSKDLITKINDIIEYIAETVETVLEWVIFAAEIAALIRWIQSLPDKIKKLLQTCLTNFTNSINQIANNLQSIPAQIANATTSQIKTFTDQVQQSFQLIKDTTQAAIDNKTSNMPDALYQVLLDPSTENVSALQTHIDSIASDSANTVSTTTTNGKIAVDPGSQP